MKSAASRRISKVRRETFKVFGALKQPIAKIEALKHKPKSFQTKQPPV